MKLIPVIDWMNGQIVRGMAGRRETYRQIETVLCDDAEPESIAAAFAQLGLTSVYVADLDAISGGEPDWSVYQRIARCGLELWIDAGAGDARRAAAIDAFEVDGKPTAATIVGLESLSGVAALESIVARIGLERLTFSLDLKAGRPMTEAAEFAGLSGEQIAGQVASLGVRRMIVLDLADVGMGRGVGTSELCRRLKHDYPTIELIAGGGVRSVDDLRRLAAAGCSAALVASALHDRRITADDIRSLETQPPNISV